MNDLAKDLKSLGSDTVYAYQGVDATLLESFPNPFAGDENVNQVTGSIFISCPEFTSLCPKTGQPDFATIEIEYVPYETCVESKSLKLYLGSFRMHGEFHEACVNRIANDLVTLLNPYYLKVVGKFTPRGGIPFWPTAEYACPTPMDYEE